MVPASGLVHWFHLEEIYQPIAADLEILETSQETKVTGPVVNGGADDRPKVSYWKLLMVSNVWALYFMDPQLPWGALLTLKKFWG